MKHPIVIVGAGLSGLWAASLLTAEGIECKVLEARDRCGGRVLSTSVHNRPELGNFDLGPTWFWPQFESRITNLVKELNIDTFEQYAKGTILAERDQNVRPERMILPENAGGESVRIKGGVQTLIDSVTSTIPDEVVELETQVTAIRYDEKGAITIEADGADGQPRTLSASAVILALPPRIVAKQIEFSPSLPPNVINNLVSKPTWMAGQAKAIAIYDRPFWREAGLSGFATSWAGPLQEIHDASPETGSGALFGFFGMPAITRRQFGKDRVLAQVKDQLVRLFGPSAQEVETILYKDWSQDSLTAVEEDLDPLREFPIYGLPPEAEMWENKIVFAGTEADSQHGGGHLEGALLAAEKAVLRAKDITSRSV
ncbi:amine oxidase [Halalkalibacillus sediminis]|uniref:Amine oxidase n=1 Tax=Halalkalibacillus sediminis TaxID=2018042 RepID=A0A2I0QSS3_9BACI|nr:FAD-dependent oxidoreductase [Halalkalibacillus sediminis]PKR77366.1 amine oxidase [Halalkalibacillus sediminis]